eukprot:4559023-Amphidinium_carterae.1
MQEGSDIAAKAIKMGNLSKRVHSFFSTRGLKQRGGSSQALKVLQNKLASERVMAAHVGGSLVDHALAVNKLYKDSEYSQKVSLANGIK